MNCEHMNFMVKADVNRLEKSETEKEIIAYCVDLTVICKDCNMPFEWVGLPLGFSHYRPTVSINGQVLRAPLIPEGGTVPEGLAGFSVTMQSFDEKEPTKQ